MPLTDEESIDKVNPYVQHDFFMPGTSRQLIDFAEHKPPVEEQAQEEYTSPACDSAVMIAGRIGRTEPCALSRGLYPGRNIQYDEDPLINGTSGEVVKTETSSMRNNLIGGAILLLLIAAL
jgi:hypothetical protein